MKAIENLEVELRTLLSDASPGAKSTIIRTLRELAGDVEKREKHTPIRESIATSRVKTYTEVKRIFHCYHCSHTYSITRMLKAGESVHVQTKARECKQITIPATEPCEIHSYVGYCPECKNAIKTWERSELEEKYLALLHRFPCG